MNMAEGYYATKSAKLLGINFKTRTPLSMRFMILCEGKSPEKTFIQLE